LTPARCVLVQRGCLAPPRAAAPVAARGPDKRAVVGRRLSCRPHPPGPLIAYKATAGAFRWRPAGAKPPSPPLSPQEYLTTPIGSALITPLPGKGCELRACFFRRVLRVGCGLRKGGPPWDLGWALPERAGYGRWGTGATVATGSELPVRDEESLTWKVCLTCRCWPMAFSNGGRGCF